MDGLQVNDRAMPSPKSNAPAAHVNFADFLSRPAKPVFRSAAAAGQRLGRKGKVRMRSNPRSSGFNASVQQARPSNYFKENNGLIAESYQIFTF